MHESRDMPNHTQGNGRSGRNVALPEENRPSWRPQEDDRYEEDRRMRGHWEDRDRRDWNRDYDYSERTGYGTRGYGYEDGDRPEGGGAQQREAWGGRGAIGQGGMYGQGGYEDGTYGRGGMQHRYGSQGYQGFAGGGHRGKGPANYQRSDERIREMVCEVLTDDDRVDASGVEVAVKDGEVTLTGTVEDRRMKRLAEDVVEGISGVKDVQNQIRIRGDKKATEGDKGRHRG